MSATPRRGPFGDPKPAPAHRVSLQQCPVFPGAMGQLPHCPMSPAQPLVVSRHPAHRLAGSGIPRGPCQGWQIPGLHLLPTQGAEARGRGWSGVRAGSTRHSPEQGRCLLVARSLMQTPDVSPRWGLLERGPIALATSLAAAPKLGHCWCRRVEPAAPVSWSSPRSHRAMCPGQQLPSTHGPPGLLGTSPPQEPHSSWDPRGREQGARSPWEQGQPWPKELAPTGLPSASFPITAESLWKGTACCLCAAVPTGCQGSG